MRKNEKNNLVASNMAPVSEYVNDIRLFSDKHAQHTQYLIYDGLLRLLSSFQ